MTKIGISKEEQLNIGGFIISLDFESYYGISKGYDYSAKNIAYYKKIEEVVPKLLELFEVYEISATWATVGLLAIESFDEFEQYKPSLLPSVEYQLPNNYKRFSDNIGKESFSKWLSFPQLIRQISQFKNQEVGSHTFGHIFCNENGITRELLKADIEAHSRLFKEKFDLDIESLVFPHDQIPKHTKVEDLGYHSVRLPYRGDAYNTNHLGDYKKFTRKSYRLMDRFFNLSGSNYFEEVQNENNFSRIPQSKFLAFNNQFGFSGLAQKKIEKEMLLAAKSGAYYHLWWHPHNMCLDMEKSLRQLKKILELRLELASKFDFPSLNFKKINEGDSASRH